MNLKHPTDQALLQDTKKLAAEERRITTAILHHIKEIDRRRLYSDIKFGSLLEYCVKELGYSESCAWRRISASRLMYDLPQIEAKIAKGTLNLTHISQANQFFRQNEIFEPTKKIQVLKEIEGLSKRESEKKLFQMSGVAFPVKETEKRISHSEIKMTIILSDHTQDLILKVRALLNKIVSMDELIQLMALETIQVLQKRKFKSLDRPSPVTTNLKNISNSVKREVFGRDKVCMNCGSIHRLNFDHRIPKALGGKNSPENIRLLCFNCNQRARIRAKL